jgi:hypothetical protein
MTISGPILTWLYERAGWPEEKDAINCWSFAISKWLSAGPKIHYLVVRMSRHTLVPHVFFAKYIDGLNVEELKPLKPQRGFRGLVDSFYFKGRVRKGKGEERKGKK